MLIYGLKNCDSCRKALKSLPEAQLVDVRTSGVPQELLNAAFATFGAALINTRSATWRALDAQARTKPPLELLKDSPVLMKRPLIEDSGTLYLGWNNDTRKALGLD